MTRLQRRLQQNGQLSGEAGEIAQQEENAALQADHLPPCTRAQLTVIFHVDTVFAHNKK